MTKEKKLSNGIQKFLEDKKREEEESAERARRKKEELVARRDPKVQRKIDKSLKVIKSSKKFYSGDASLDENAALMMQNEQPDEDDYGYTSNISDQFHKKLMEKYQQLPADKKFSTGTGKNKAMSKEEIQTTKNRVKNALASKEDDQHQSNNFRHGPVKRTSKVTTTNGAGSSSSISSHATDKKNFQKPKPKLKAAPIVDFQELLKLAEQKQHEEITIEVPTKKEPERLLTSKEKRELEEIEASRRAKMKPNRIPKMGAIPRVGESSKHDRNNNENQARRPIAVAAVKPKVPVKPQTSSSSKPEQRIPDKLKKPRLSPGGSSSNSPSRSRLRDALQKSNGGSPRPSSSNQIVPAASRGGGIPPNTNNRMKSIVNGQRPAPATVVNKNRPSTSSKDPERPRDFPPKDLLRSREFPPKDLMRSREFPPKDLMRSREFPPRDMKRPKQQQLIPNKRKFKKTKFTETISQFLETSTGRIEDEESDYDSEMDDFIDDGEENLDYSSEIKRIFGYDKSRFVITYLFDLNMIY